MTSILLLVCTIVLAIPCASAFTPGQSLFSYAPTRTATILGESKRDDGFILIANIYHDELLAEVEENSSSLVQRESASAMTSTATMGLGPRVTTSSRSSSTRKSSALRATTAAIRYGPAPTETQAVIGGYATGAAPTLLDRLTSISSVASFLCIIDCTVLPLMQSITMLFPLLNIAGGNSNMAHTLHELGHAMALYFVLPVGSLSTATSYANHRKLWLCLPGIVGLILIYVSNAGHMHLHSATANGLAGGLNPLLLMPHSWLHAVSEGWAHRVVNILGCALMLSGNYLGRVFGTGQEDGRGQGVRCLIPGCFAPHAIAEDDNRMEENDSFFFQIERPSDDK